MPWNYKGGKRKHSEGYLEIKSPSHPHANNSGYILEHRLVMEQHLGRYLDPKEIVHHINHNRSDNRLENLALMENHKIHLSQHMKKDMTDRKCIQCGSNNKTSLYRKTGYLNWYRHPISKKEWVCKNCYKRIRRSSSKRIFTSLK